MKSLHGNGNVPPSSIEIGHLKIDHPYAFFFAHFSQFFTFCHSIFLLTRFFFYFNIFFFIFLSISFFHFYYLKI